MKKGISINFPHFQTIKAFIFIIFKYRGTLDKRNLVRFTIWAFRFHFKQVNIPVILFIFKGVNVNKAKLKIQGVEA